MALLKYFKRIELSADEQIESVLPKANGALSQLMPSSMMMITICSHVVAIASLLKISEVRSFSKIFIRKSSR